MAHVKLNPDFPLEKLILKPPRPSGTPPREGNCSAKCCAAVETIQTADVSDVSLNHLTLNMALQFPSRGGVASEPPRAKLDGVVYFVKYFQLII